MTAASGHAATRDRPSSASREPGQRPSGEDRGAIWRNEPNEGFAAGLAKRTQRARDGVNPRGDGTRAPSATPRPAAAARSAPLSHCRIIAWSSADRRPTASRLWTHVAEIPTTPAEVSVEVLHDLERHPLPMRPRSPGGECSMIATSDHPPVAANDLAERRPSLFAINAHGMVPPPLTGPSNRQCTRHRPPETDSRVVPAPQPPITETETETGNSRGPVPARPQLIALENGTSPRGPRRRRLR